MRAIVVALLLCSTAHAGRFGIDIAIAIAEAESIKQESIVREPAIPVAAEKPKPKRKPRLWYRYTDSCKPCQAFAKNKEAQAWVNENFELVKIQGYVPDFHFEGYGRLEGGYTEDFVERAKALIAQGTEDERKIVDRVDSDAR